MPRCRDPGSSPDRAYYVICRELSGRTTTLGMAARRSRSKAQRRTWLSTAADAHRARQTGRCDPTPTKSGERIVSQSPEVCPDMTPRTSLRPLDVVIRIAIVGLTLGTAYIHSTLGGLLFTLNAVGYVVAAAAIIIPLGLAIRFRWFVRLGLVGYAATAIAAWAVQGPYYTTAYIAKGIEIVLITLLVVDFARMDGNPINVVKSELALLIGKLGRRTATGQAGA
jgi:hypothetical protein